MALDPRAQLALTMVTGLTTRTEPRNRRRTVVGHERERLRQEQRATEALTQALLDPCATVQEAMLTSLLQQSTKDPSLSHEKDSPSD